MSRADTRRPGKRRERGFALLIVLWTLALLSLLVSDLVSSGRSEVRVATDLRGQLTVESDADSALDVAAFHLLDRTDGHWNSNGVPHEIAMGDTRVRVRITDEAEKVNLNTASADLLAALFATVAVDPVTAARLADAVVDWRTEDPHRPAADKAPPYRAAGLPYLPPGAPFRGVDEIALVAGMTPRLVAQLAPHLTVHSSYGPAPETGDAVVREALQKVRERAGVLPVAFDGDGIRVVRVIACATGEKGRFTREAVLRLNPRSLDRPMTVLDWK